MAKKLEQTLSRNSVAAALAEYEKKRDFTKTAEPSPEAVGEGPRAKRESMREAKRDAKPIFVVQEHHASTLHYDFRLESDGVLKSWAVPKQPAMDPSVKRLAVRVEDHPLGYATFSGDIPEGQYGAGHVEVWDHGTYEPAGDGKAGRSVSGAIEDGKVEFVLHGEKLRGGFTLVRAFGGGKGGGGAKGGKSKRENWLLIKRKDDAARPRSRRRLLRGRVGPATGAAARRRPPPPRPASFRPA